jgi:hypothetical protein
MRTINQYIIENKRKVKLNLRTVKSIRAIWTPEMYQDISAFHNIDAEAELTRILNEELSRNIDYQILRNFLNNDLH